MISVADMDWVVINLERTPERLAQLRANNASVGLGIETFPAVDGLLIDRGDLVRTGLMAADLQWRLGAIGAALSHRLCWKQAVDTGRPIGILEDDHDFVQRADKLLTGLPGDWFGFNTGAAVAFELVPGLGAREISRTSSSPPMSAHASLLVAAR